MSASQANSIKSGSGQLAGASAAAGLAAVAIERPAMQARGGSRVAYARRVCRNRSGRVKGITGCGTAMSSRSCCPWVPPLSPSHSRRRCAPRLTSQAWRASGRYASAAGVDGSDPPGVSGKGTSEEPRKGWTRVASRPHRPADACARTVRVASPPGCSHTQTRLDISDELATWPRTAELACPVAPVTPTF